MNKIKTSNHWEPATVSVDCKRLRMFPLKISFSFWLGWNLMHLDYALGSDTPCQMVTSGGTASVDLQSLCEKFNVYTSTGKQLVCVRERDQRWQDICNKFVVLNDKAMHRVSIDVQVSE